MKQLFPFKLPVRIEDGRYIVADNNELVLSNWDATPEEFESIVVAINGYAEAVEALSTLVERCDEYEQTDSGLESMEDLIENLRSVVYGDAVTNLLEKLK